MATATYPISVDDLKRHLRIVGSGEDEYLASILAAACEHIGKLLDIDLTDSEAENDCPEMTKHAIRLLVGHWYENREATTFGQESKPVPLAFDSLITNMRGILAR